MAAVSVPAYGFSPTSVKQAQALIRELARVLLTGRPDAEFLRPGLITRLNSELNAFIKHNQLDASEGFATPEARKQCIESALDKMAAWDAQPSEPTAK